MAYQYNSYDNAWVKTNKRMKNYRVYVQDPQTGDYYYQYTDFDTLSSVVSYCKERYKNLKGYITDAEDKRILRRF